jgi:cobalt/nickel transport system permease protein
MSEAAPTQSRGKQKRGWVEKTVAEIAGSIERAVFTEELARKDGWLQKVDPRAKLGMFLATVLAASLTNSLIVLLILYVLTLLAARLSLIPFDFFVKRVWLGIPFFAGIVILPSIFFVPGQRLFDLPYAPSLPGIMSAIVFIARVGVSVSLAILLVLVTPWADLLKSLSAVKVPQVFILLLSMTYRYIFLFLRTTNGMFEARKSRVVGKTRGNEQRRWISNSMGNLMNRSFKMSNEVYTAMLARGFTGQVRVYNTFRMKPSDWLTLAGTIIIAVGLSLIKGYLGWI